MSANVWLIGAAVFLGVARYAIRQQRLKHRRRDSLRRDGGGGYVWVEIDGTRGQSRDDPRGRWDSDDAADGDGGGGGD